MIKAYFLVYLAISLQFLMIYSAIQLRELIGSIQYSILTNSDQNTWIISPINPATSKILIIFNSLNMVQGEMQIYDVSNFNAGIPLFTCSSCGTTIPPPFYSTTGSILIKSQATIGVSFRKSSFSLQYIAIPLDKTDLLKNIVINMNMGYAQIQPIKFHNFIMANSIQQWIIQQSPRQLITFSFVLLQLPDSCSVQLQIFDQINIAGKLIFNGCKSSDMPKQWLYSTTGTALVVLTSGIVDTLADFKLTYYVDTNLFNCGNFIQPGSIEDPSAIITDGSKSNELMRRGVDCTWLIKPTDKATVSLLLNWVSIKYGSYIIVYDGSKPSSTAILWYAVGATVTVPPVITSTGNALFIEYSSDTSDSVKYFGFEGETITNNIGSSGSGRGYSTLAMSSYIDIIPPGNGQMYTRNSNYIWYITPDNSVGSILFSISYLNLPYPGDALIILDNDLLITDYSNTKIYESFIIAKYTGTKLPLEWIQTTGPHATILFQTKNPNPHIGDLFKLSYYSNGPNYQCGFTTNPAIMNDPSFRFSDGSASLEQLYKNQYCEWNLIPSLTNNNNNEIKSIVLIFDRFSVNNGRVIIFIGNVLSGSLYTEISDTTAVPAPITITGSSIGIIYETDFTSSGYGFSLTYYAVSTSHSFPGNNLVTLTCSSMTMLSIPLHNIDIISPGTNLKWILAPITSSSHIYISFISLSTSLDCVNSYLKLYDGIDISGPLLGTFCRDSFYSSDYKWYKSTSTKLLLNYVTHNITIKDGNFELSYYSDGPNYHCGFAINPALMKAPSMIFTDGSGTNMPLYTNQHCEWIIQPSLSLFENKSNPSIATTTTTSAKDNIIVIEFLECDLGGASIELYDGKDDQAALLYSCVSCTAIPYPIVIHSGIAFVRFISEAITTGNGFKLLYWTTTFPPSSLDKYSLNVIQEQKSSLYLLQIPFGIQLSSILDNSSIAFSLTSTNEHSMLSYYSSYIDPTLDNIESINTFSYDGRELPGEFDSLLSIQQVCGNILTGNINLNYLKSNSIQYQPTQRISSFISINGATKYIYNLQNSGITKTNHINPKDSTIFQGSPICKYRLHSGSSQAISINIKKFSVGKHGRLKIYGGLTGEDHLLYDSMKPPSKNTLLSKGKDGYNKVINGESIQSMNITAPCGKATIILEFNYLNDSYDLNNINKDLVDYSLSLSYINVLNDVDQICRQYYQSLQPTIKKVDPYIPLYIGISAFVFIIILIILAYYAKKIQAKRGYIFYISPNKPKTYRKITPTHPKYTGKFDQFWNKFLPFGTCIVCKNHSIAVLRLNCGHYMCIEDVKGYLESALGDVSMFPVKCPMHYEGCTGNINAYIAKRVLSETQYNRFNEFSDRAIYGDGMRCIFCYNYVNFPENMNKIARVICPYCQQYFCILCKKAWHIDKKCTIDIYDDTLETWKQSSGAQKCPICCKLIEKDDPSTCNHMIHKITDGIPCIRERTDFCYCCGEEITGDYPHLEVKHLGINHFPDGVFQRCRTIIWKEKEKERERFKKLKRMKSSYENVNTEHSPISTTAPLLSQYSPTRSSTTSIVPAEIIWMQSQVGITTTNNDSNNNSFNNSNSYSITTPIINTRQSMITNLPNALEHMYDEESSIVSSSSAYSLNRNRSTTRNNPNNTLSLASPVRIQPSIRSDEIALVPVMRNNNTTSSVINNNYNYRNNINSSTNNINSNNINYNHNPSNLLLGTPKVSVTASNNINTINNTYNNNINTNTNRNTNNNNTRQHPRSSTYAQRVNNNINNRLL